MMRLVTLFAITLLAPTIAPAQTIPRDLASDVKYGALDILTVWGAPFHASARSYETAAASLAAWGVVTLADADVAAWVRSHPNAGVMKAIEPFREGSGLSLVNAGDGGWSTNGALAVYGIGLVARSRTIRDVGMGCLAGAEATSIVRQAVYDAVSRERPLFADNIDGKDVFRPGRPYDVRFPGKNGWFDNAFFAGHVTTVTQCVSFITHRFHLGYVEPVFWAFAAGLSLGRIADQRHYTSDVFLGALFGFATGKLLGNRSRAREEKRVADKSIVPSAHDGDARSWIDGVYIAQSGSALQLGWRTQP